jgi:hypothetical protein
MTAKDNELSLFIGGRNDLESPYRLDGNFWEAGARGNVFQGLRKVGTYFHKTVDGPFVATEAGLLDYAEELLKQINPFNVEGSVHDSLVSIKESAVGMVTLDAARVANAWDSGPLGQTADTTGIPYYGTRAALGGASAVATTALVLSVGSGLGLTTLGEEWTGTFGLHGAHHGLGRHFETIIRGWGKKNFKFIFPGKNGWPWIGFN